MTPEHKYYPHTIEQKLGYLVEECGEVLAAVGKTQRWGLESYNPDKGPSSETNRDWILRELIDLESACAMVRKALAALPDAPPSPADNPDADATDCAHPAWWRGNDQGVWSACELLTKTLDGVAGGVCREPLETVRRRIAALRDAQPSATVDPRIVELAKRLPSAEAMEFFAVDQREFYNRLSADEARALADAAALIREMAGETGNE